jgi:hypothetical protein
LINDTSGYSVPVFYISFSSSQANNEILIEESMGVKRTQCGFNLSCLFFNTRLAHWEPLIENWNFGIEFEHFKNNEFTNKLEILSKESPLNLDISDEMFGIGFTAYYDWKNHFETHEKNKTQKKIIYSPINQDIMKELSSQTAVEQMSICKVWNDTGFEIHFEASLAAYTSKKTVPKTLLKMKSGENKELLVTWTIGKEESLAAQGILDKIKADVRFKVEGGKDILCLSLDVDTPGTRCVAMTFRDKQYALICKVYTENQKKIVRLTSAVLIDNRLSFPVYIHIHEQNSGGSILQVLPGCSVGMPVDKIYNYVSFHTELEYKEKAFNKFSLPGFNSYKPVELSFCKRYAIIFAYREMMYDKIIIEPIYVIQNSLPVTLAIHGNIKDSGKKSEVVELISPKGKVLFDQFSINAQMSLKFATHTFVSNEFRISLQDNKQKQFLYFDTAKHRLSVEVLRPRIQNSYTEQFIITGTCCLINDSSEECYFFTNQDNSTIFSPFVNSQEDKDITLFSRLDSLQITTKNDKLNYSDRLDIHTTGDYTIDVPNSNKGFYNFAVRVSNVLACKL